MQETTESGREWVSFDGREQTSEEMVWDALHHDYGFTESDKTVKALLEYKNVVAEIEKTSCIFHSVVNNILKAEDRDIRRLAGVIISLLIRGGAPEYITQDVCQHRYNMFICDLNTNAEISIKTLCREVFQPENDRKRIETDRIFNTGKIFCRVKYLVRASDSAKCYKRRVVEAVGLPSLTTDEMARLVIRLNHQLYRHQVKSKFKAMVKKHTFLETQLKYSREIYLQYRNREIYDFMRAL
jgi:hypothetical protein